MGGGSEICKTMVWCDCFGGVRVYLAWVRLIGSTEADRSPEIRSGSGWVGSGRTRVLELQLLTL